MGGLTEPPPVEFAALPDGSYAAEGHGLAEAEVRAALERALTDRTPAEAQLDAASAQISEGWYSDSHGYGHDCTQHQEVEQKYWAPGCFDGGFRAVTFATSIRVPETINRVDTAAMQPRE